MDGEPSSHESRRYLQIRFGRFVVELRERRLLADGKPITAGPCAFDVLLTLIERVGELAPRTSCSSAFGLAHGRSEQLGMAKTMKAMRTLTAGRQVPFAITTALPPERERKYRSPLQAAKQCCFDTLSVDQRSSRDRRMNCIG
jgi:hypothetical protein